MNIATNCIGSDEVVQVLIKRKEELELMSAMVEERIDEAPQGTLRISHTGGYTQFYHRIEPGDTRGKYIRKNRPASTRHIPCMDAIYSSLFSSNLTMAVENEP